MGRIAYLFLGAIAVVLMAAGGGAVVVTAPPASGISGATISPAKIDFGPTANGNNVAAGNGSFVVFDGGVASANGSPSGGAFCVNPPTCSMYFGANGSSNYSSTNFLAGGNIQIAAGQQLGMATNGQMLIKSDHNGGAAAIGTVIDSSRAYGTTGAKLMDWYNNGVADHAWVDNDGGFFSGSNFNAYSQRPGASTCLDWPTCNDVVTANGPYETNDGGFSANSATSPAYKCFGAAQCNYSGTSGQSVSMDVTSSGQVFLGTGSATVVTVSRPGQSLRLQGNTQVSNLDAGTVFVQQIDMNPANQGLAVIAFNTASNNFVLDAGVKLSGNAGNIDYYFNCFDPLVTTGTGDICKGDAVGHASTLVALNYTHTFQGTGTNQTLKLATATNGGGTIFGTCTSSCASAIGTTDACTVNVSAIPSASALFASVTAGCSTTDAQGNMSAHIQE